MKPPVISGQFRGFATATALCLLALVSVVAVGFSAFLVRDIRRTGRLAVDAQLQQMLLAGAAAAPQYLGKWDGHHQVLQMLAVPDELTRQEGMVVVEIFPATPVHPDTATVCITASLKASHAGQVLDFKQAEGRWMVAGASLRK